MPPDTVPDEPDYFSRYLRDGVKSPDDAQYDPALQYLLGKLYARQRYQAQELATYQFNERITYRTPDHPFMVKDHRADNEAQEKRFAEERDRCIRDYQAAQVLREEREQRELARRQGRDQTSDQTRTR